MKDTMNCPSCGGYDVGKTHGLVSVIFACSDCGHQWAISDVGEDPMTMAKEDDR